MKKLLTLLGVTVVALILLITVGFFVIKSQKVPEVNVVDIDLSTVENGTYSGQYSAGLVKVVVEVQVEEHQIVAITLKEHQNGLGAKAERIVNEIIQEQSLSVAVVSGATLSSNVIRKAVQEALSQ